ncbi:hypothetical protein [Sphingobacterium kyonggiense]
MIVFYKFFYIFFLYYSKIKNDIPWIGALTVIVICTFMFVLSLLGVTGLFYPLMEVLNKFGVQSKILLLIFVCLFLYLLGKIYYFILFKKMKISKINGKHPSFDFNPTNLDKFKVYFVSVLIFSSPFIVKGIQMYYEGKLFK